MEFDKSKVYTALNADEVKIGSKGYFADNLYELQCVIHNKKDNFFTIKEILKPDEKFRFLAKNLVGAYISWNLFYLVEEPKEKKFRPYKDTDEMIEDFKKRYNSYGGWSGKNNPMYSPLIWIKPKGTEKNSYLITRFSEKKVTFILECSIYTMPLYALFEDYTYLDGSPCGIEEYL